jgi:hypothetical protein
MSKPDSFPEQAPVHGTLRKRGIRNRSIRFYAKVLFVALAAYFLCWLVAFLVLQHSRGRYYRALSINEEVVPTSSYLSKIDTTSLTSATDLKLNQRPHHAIYKSQAEDSHSVFIWEIITTGLNVNRTTASIEAENVQHASYCAIISSNLKEKQ